ncbi:MAG: OsmC family protein [Spirochaetales bacterium]|nr:OsmC family protein [Spirochaetales bacterium]
MANRITVDFKEGFRGEGKNDRGSQLEIGEEEWHPYELLFTALASCMYATFLDIARKKKLEYSTVTITIEGEKRDEVPAFLKKADILYTVKGADTTDEKTHTQFQKTLMLAEKYCSIYNTLTKVAELNSKIIFE